MFVCYRKMRNEMWIMQKKWKKNVTKIFFAHSNVMMSVERAFEIESRRRFFNNFLHYPTISIIWRRKTAAIECYVIFALTKSNNTHFFFIFSYFFQSWSRRNMLLMLFCFFLSLIHSLTSLHKYISLVIKCASFCVVIFVRRSTNDRRV